MSFRVYREKKLLFTLPSPTTPFFLTASLPPVSSLCPLMEAKGKRKGGKRGRIQPPTPPQYRSIAYLRNHWRKENGRKREAEWKGIGRIAKGGNGRVWQQEEWRWVTGLLAAWPTPEWVAAACARRRVPSSSLTSLDLCPIVSRPPRPRPAHSLHVTARTRSGGGDVRCSFSPAASPVPTSLDSFLSCWSGFFCIYVLIFILLVL